MRYSLPKRDVARQNLMTDNNSATVVPIYACGRDAASRRPLAWMFACWLAIGLSWGGNAFAVRIAVISDLNSSYGSVTYGPTVDRAVKAIIDQKPALVISTGDMVAGQQLSPLLRSSSVEAMWAGFHQHVTDPITGAGIPLAVTPGNHDASVYTRFWRERLIYREQWETRRPALDFVDATYYPFHYAFAVDDILFVSLDVTRPGELEPEQMKWLSDLLAQHGDRYGFSVVFSHLPLWPFAKGRETEVIGDPKLEALLAEAGIDLYLSGHHHTFYPGFKSGIAYLSQSCLGSGLRRLIGSDKPSQRILTLIDIEHGEAEVTALTGQQFDQVIDVGHLPTGIRFAQGEMTRLDLVPVGQTDVAMRYGTNPEADNMLARTSLDNK